jgi:membrane-associated sensor protein
MKFLIGGSCCKLVIHLRAKLQNQLALGALAILLVGPAAAAPFAATPLPRAVAFVPFLNAAFSVTSLITAILLLGHFSLYRSPALLVLASGYLFSALIVIPHALTFPRRLFANRLIGCRQSNDGLAVHILAFWIPECVCDLHLA